MSDEYVGPVFPTARVVDSTYPREMGEPVPGQVFEESDEDAAARGVNPALLETRTDDEAEVAPYEEWSDEELDAELKVRGVEAEEASDPADKAQLLYEDDAKEEVETPSAGTSSSESESSSVSSSEKPQISNDKPAPTTESPTEPDQKANSSARSTATARKRR
jgi:hypothetical protein